MGAIIYILCTLASLICTLLLFRAYTKKKSRLVLWSALCFVGLTLNNFLLFIDFHVMPHLDLSLWRAAPALVGAGILAFGLIWEST
jgi:hypothetical protein